MAFSHRVKGELARIIPGSSCCQMTELGTMLRLEGTVKASDAGSEVEIALSHPAAARKVFLLFKHLLGERTPDLKHVKRGTRRAYVVKISGATGAEHEILRAAQEGFADPDLAVPEKTCCRRSLLRAVILTRASFAEPERQYHLEIPLDPWGARFVAKVFESLGIPVHAMERKSGPVLYLKDGERIVEVLSHVGAHDALLRLENIRVAKDVRNSINRVVNCETANVDKTVSAAMEQIEAIRRIDAQVGLTSLSPKLQEVALLRVKHPYASLQELAELTSPPVSRSTVSYRLRRLMQVAAELPDP